MRRAAALLGGLVALAVVAGGASCGLGSRGPVETRPPGAKLRVVATTSIVADAVVNVGGDLVEVATLLPLGADPHTFDPSPRDVASVADAQVVFANGAGLELFLERLLASAGEDVTTVYVSDGVDLLEFGSDHEDDHGAVEDHASADPHVWLDPRSVVVWADNIAGALAALDPTNSESYAANAEAFKADLQALDQWIETQVALIAPEDRQIVTDHASFGYFARRYGFRQVGTVFPGYSSMAEPSARTLAELEEAIKKQGVKAVFVGLTVNPDLAQRVAEDTGAQMVFLYTGSLSEPAGPAPDYVSFMQYNVSAIVAALR
jgi:ABC-type Zn uptake system ZnuABC Zn-binding protein ZnuA